MQLGVAASLILTKPAYAPDSTHDILSKPAFAPEGPKDTLGWKASSPDSHSRHLLDLTTKVRRSAFKTGAGHGVRMRCQMRAL